MGARLTREVIQRRANVGLIVAFFVFLWLPAADTFLHLDRTPSPNENRSPARFPEFKPGFAAMGDFVSGIEAYFGDHFGFRNRLVSWEHHWKWQWFRTSKINVVLVGKFGWLFLTDRLMADDVMGNRPFSDQELEAWRDLLQGRRDWLAQRGIRYLFVIAPDKHTIYPEHLPDWLAGATKPPHRLDQFIKYMQAHGDLPVVDLRQPLLDAKKDARIYMQTDTHWNEMGGYVAYRSIVEHAAALGLLVKPLELPAFQVSFTVRASGDLARMLGWENAMKETDLVSLTQKPPLPPLQFFSVPYFLPHARDPNTDPILSENHAARCKAVMFRDSFAGYFTKFLGNNFGRILYVWQQNWDKRVIESEKPDIVIDEMVERHVISLDPLELKKQDEHPGAQALADH